MAMLSALTAIDVKYHHAQPTLSLQRSSGAVKQAFMVDSARTASPEEWVAACAAMLSALTALTSKGVLELEPGIVKEVVAGARGARSRGRGLAAAGQRGGRAPQGRPSRCVRVTLSCSSESWRWRLALV